MSTQPHSPATPVPASKKMDPMPILLGIVSLIAIGAIAMLVLNGSPSHPAMNSDLPSAATGDVVVPATLDNPQQNLEALKSTLSKEKFLKKLYSIDRDNYNLYEKAGAYLNLDVDAVRQFFFECCDLKNEADIFSQIPAPAENFSEVAYKISVGSFDQIGQLEKDYYSQPEFYTFVDPDTGVVNREYAFRGITHPELNQWVDHGIQVYPADQWGTTDISSGESFTAVVFVTNTWNNQNYQGVNIVANQDAMNNFDLTISEDSTGNSYFLLGPTFPRFASNWATKIVITGKPKPGVAPGTYDLGFNPIAPPSEFNNKYAKEYPSLYIPYGFLRPSDNYINMHITVTE